MTLSIELLLPLIPTLPLIAKLVIMGAIGAAIYGVTMLIVAKEMFVSSLRLLRRRRNASQEAVET